MTLATTEERLATLEAKVRALTDRLLALSGPPPGKPSPQAPRRPALRVVGSDERKAA